MNKKIAIICCGDEDYFLKPPHAPIITLPSFRKNFGDKADLVIGNFLIKRAENPKDMWDSEALAND